MDRKTKLVAACAIGAAAILIGAGIARWAIGQDARPEPEPEAQEQELEQLADGPADAGAEDGLSAYLGSAWSSEDGKTALTLTDGTMVERSGDDVQVTYFAVEGASADGGGLCVDVLTSKSARGEQAEGVIRIEAADDKTVLTCDALVLAESYVLDAAEAYKVALAAHSARLNELLGADDDEIEAAIAAWSAKRSPYATQATWDGEVYIDCGGGTVTTAFALNDGAGTLVQLQLDEGTGELSAL